MKKDHTIGSAGLTFPGPGAKLFYGPVTKCDFARGCEKVRFSGMIGHIKFILQFLRLQNVSFSIV